MFISGMCRPIKNQISGPKLFKFPQSLKLWRVYYIPSILLINFNNTITLTDQSTYTHALHRKSCSAYYD